MVDIVGAIGLGIFLIFVCFLFFCMSASFFVDLLNHIKEYKKKWKDDDKND